MERLEDYVKVGDTGGDILIYFCNYEDYENETDAGAKDDCGDLAVNPHGKKTFCKVKPDELFQVPDYMPVCSSSVHYSLAFVGKLPQKQ